MLTRPLLKSPAAVGICAAMLFLCPTQGQAQETFRVVGVAEHDVLNIRSAPKAGAGVVGTIPANGVDLVSLGECKAWCRIRYRSVVGWVDRRYLAIDPPPTQSAPSSDPIGDCNSEDAPRRLTGCSALISRGDLPPASLAVAYSRRSDAYLATSKLDAALSDRTKAAEIEPDDTGHRLRLGAVYLQRAASWPLPSKLDAALKDYGDAIRVDPTNHQAYAGRSIAYVLKDDYDNAITDLRAALGHGATTVYAAALARLCERRGIQHLLKKQLDQAITRFTEAIALSAPRDELYAHRASAYAFKDEIELALKDYSEAIRINADNVDAYIGRGELHRRRTALDMALKDFDEAIRRQPSHLAALMFRGLTREDTRDREGAMNDYQAVLRFDPKHRLAKAGIVRLRAYDAIFTQDAAARSSRKNGGIRTTPSAKQECFAFNDQTFCK